MSLNTRLERLYARRRFGMRPGLERMQALMERLGHPERELLTIHVAGTNGKGSVVAMIAAILQSAELGSVGRYTSPHLLCFNERIAIDGIPVSDEKLAPVLETVETEARALVAEDAAAGEPTFFECATAAAFLLFQRAGVRLAVIETGLGGRLDATNIVLPLLAVISRIGLEHCDYLGSTIEAVATEKAGIIKPGRPVVVGAMTEEALGTITDVARQREAPLIQATETATVTVLKQGFEGLQATLSTTQRGIGRVRLPIAGAFQAENLCTAVAAVETFGQITGLPIPTEAFREGLARLSWPGRFQQVCRDPIMIVDGAHNPDAMRHLREALRKTGFKGDVALVAGFCNDKDVIGCMRALVGVVRQAWAVPTPSPRSLTAEDTAQIMRQAGLEATAASSWQAGIAAAEAWAAAEQGLVLICGSLFLAGAVLDHYQAFPWRVTRSQDLNEQLKV